MQVSNSDSDISYSFSVNCTPPQESDSGEDSFLPQNHIHTRTPDSDETSSLSNHSFCQYTAATSKGEDEHTTATKAQAVFETNFVSPTEEETQAAELTTLEKSINNALDSIVSHKSTSQNEESFMEKAIPHFMTIIEAFTPIEQHTQLACSLLEKFADESADKQMFFYLTLVGTYPTLKDDFDARLKVSIKNVLASQKEDEHKLTSIKTTLSMMPAELRDQCVTTLLTELATGNKKDHYTFHAILMQLYPEASYPDLEDDFDARVIVDLEDSELQIPPNVSIASIVIDSSLEEDRAMIMDCGDTLIDNVPLITSSRLFINTIKKLDSFSFIHYPNSDESLKRKVLKKENWLFFKNTSGDLVVCLPHPKDPLLLTAKYLQNLGYDSSNLTEFSLKDTATRLQPNSHLSQDEYREQITNQLPTLFKADPNIKKRFSIIGHGRTSKPGQDGHVVGLTINQFQQLLSKFEKIGVDYLNYLTCFAGGRNLTRVLEGIHPKFTISVCSSDDSPTYVEGLSQKKFWAEINDLFEKRAVRYRPDDFIALSHIYGGTLSGLPVVSINGKPYFEAVDIHGKTSILSYRTSVARELHPEKRNIPVTSISSPWSQSEKFEDRVNHCQQQINALTILNKPQGDLLKERYITLRDLYHITQNFRSDPEIVRLIKEISVLEKGLVTSLPTIRALEVDREALLIYPQVVKTPIVLESCFGEDGKTLPYFISKIPDHHRILFSKIETKDGSPQDVIKESLSRKLKLSLDTHTRNMFMVKTLSGVEQGVPITYNHVMTVFDPLAKDKNSNFALYDKEGKWYCLKGDEEKEISLETVLACVHYYSRETAPSTKALQFSAGGFLAARQTNEYFSTYLFDCFDSEADVKILNDFKHKSEDEIIQLMADVIVI